MPVKLTLDEKLGIVNLSDVVNFSMADDAFCVNLSNEFSAPTIQNMPDKQNHHLPDLWELFWKLFVWQEKER